MESSANRAATSETRVAPFVITRTCITIRMINITIPTTRPLALSELPTTKELKALTIFPSNFCPCVKISLVDETFIPRPKSVTRRITRGNEVKLLAFGV